MLYAKSAGNGEYQARNAADVSARRIWASRIEAAKAAPVSVSMVVGPELASVMLEGNHSNRKVKPGYVHRLACAMRDGRFRHTHQGIAFDSSGRVLDGQHRLLAIIKSGCTVTLQVHLGLSADAFDVIDIGHKRGHGDILGIAGVKNSSRVASAVRVILAIKAGLRSLGKNAASADEVLAWVSENGEDIQTPIMDAENIRMALGGKVASSGLGAALHMIRSVADYEFYDEFVHRVRTGVGVGSEGDPIGRLRARMIKYPAKGPEQAAVVIKAWNAFRNGTECNLLGWRIDEQFPSIVP